MVRRPPARCLTVLCLGVVLAGCAGATGVDTAADRSAASAAEHVSGAAEPGQGTTDAGPTRPTPTGATPAGDGPGGNPGAPGADPAGGGDSTDVVAQGNPGAPGDVAVFEEAGVPYSVLKDDAAGTCADGVCTLLEPVVGAGNPDDVGGIDECVIREQSDIRYDPPARDGSFRHGATVQATVDCTADTSGDTSVGTAGETSQDQAPPDEPQG